MVVRRIGAGHVRADRASVGVRVILVLDPDQLAERLRREARDVAGGEDVGAPADTTAIVDDDPVVDRQPGRLGELRRRLDPEPGDDAVGLERPAAAEPDDAVLDPFDDLAGQYLDTLLPVVAVDELRRARAERAWRRSRSRGTPSSP